MKYTKIQESSNFICYVFHYKKEFYLINFKIKCILIKIMM